MGGLERYDLVILLDWASLPAVLSASVAHKADWEHQYGPMY